MIEAAILILIGLGAGLAAATLGIGGGVIFVPALVAVLGFDQHLAQGTSLAVILPTAIVATIGHARRGHVSRTVAIPVALGGVAGALAGAALAQVLDADVLRRLFSLLLLAVAVRMGLRALHLASARTDAPDP